MTTRRSKRTTAQKARSKSATQLDPSEWDFREIPFEETEACYLYEYGRELTKVWPRLSLVMRNWEKKLCANIPAANATEVLIGRIFTLRFGDFPQVHPSFFPRTSWRRLSQQQRAAMVGAVNMGVGHFSRREHSRQLLIRTLREFGPKRGTSVQQFIEAYEHLNPPEVWDQTDYGLFAINWSYGSPEIIKTFKSWVEEQRNQRARLGFPPPKRRTTARGGFRDRLQRLGALRIVNHYSPTELSPDPDATNPNRKLNVPAPYGHSSDLHEAAKKARTMIERIRAVGKTPRELITLRWDPLWPHPRV